MERHTTSYLQLIKPGITISNTLTGMAGYFLAASIFGWSLTVFVGAIGGIALIIASACVVNNVLDRNIDRKMKRTSKREVVRGTINVPSALIFATLLGIAGFTLLALWTNWLAFALGVIAYVWYVAIYGIAKRTTPFSTLIGGVPGALPPVAGYVALSGTFDAAAVLLFFILFFWQLPHFYAISIFRRDDYASANLPVWAVRYGIKSAKVQIFASVVLYAVAAALLAIYGYVGVTYIIMTSALSAYWIMKGISLYTKVDDVKWARTMFGVSLIVLLSMCLMISAGGYLP